MEGEFQATGNNAGQPLVKLSSRRRWVVTVGVMTGMFLAALEATVVSTAMPTVIASLGGLDHYSWVFSAYLITSTVTVPVWGKLSDLYGRRVFYQVGIAIFLIGSALSGLSTSMTQLIAFRALQGLGAGALVPLGMTIIGDVFTLAERARMQALFSGVWGLASVVGPVVGGFLTDQLSWRWVFYINLPVGIAAAIIIGLSLTEPRRVAKAYVDYAGAAALMAAITLLMLALVEGGASLRTLFDERNLSLMVGSVGLFAGFIFIESRVRDPIVPLSLFKNRAVSISVSAGFLAGVAMFGAISFVPLYAQGALGASATQAGSLLTPLMLSWVSLSVVGGRLLLKVGYKRNSIAGFVILTIGFVLLALFQRTSPRVLLYLDLVLIGAGLGLTMLTLLIVVQQAVPGTQLGIATSLNQFSRSIGGAVGVAVMGAVLSAGLANNLEDLAKSRPDVLTPDAAAKLAEDPNALIDPKSRSALSPRELEALQSSMAKAVGSVFWAGAVFSALALLVVLWLPERLERPDSLRHQETSSTEAGERMLIAEMATLEPEDQPVVSSD